MKQPVQKKLRLADDMAKEAKEDDDEESAAEEKQPEVWSQKWIVRIWSKNKLF